MPVITGVETLRVALPTRRVHKWTGLASAIFVLFFSITGAVAVYYSEIDRLNAPGLALPQAVQRQEGKHLADLAGDL